MAKPEILVQSHQHLLTKLQKELTALTSGKTRVSRMAGAKWVDATEEHVRSVRRSIAHLEAILRQDGQSTPKGGSSSAQGGG
ncbi:MAG TPA: hypothetical protein VHT04_01420 [Stellaceae bacterium]|jgi:hypothetical protein|nr:hypothetical protein [Stellaceae bacterium]